MMVVHVQVKWLVTTWPETYWTTGNQSIFKPSTQHAFKLVCFKTVCCPNYNCSKLEEWRDNLLRAVFYWELKLHCQIRFRLQTTHCVLMRFWCSLCSFHFNSVFIVSWRKSSDWALNNATFMSRNSPRHTRRVKAGPSNLNNRSHFPVSLSLRVLSCIKFVIFAIHQSSQISWWST